MSDVPPSLTDDPQTAAALARIKGIHISQPAATHTKVTSSFSSDVVQFEVVGNEYRVYKWDEYDLSLEVPATALAQGKMATFTIRAMPSTDDFTLPEDDMYLVSGIYHIECQEVFQEEVTIRIKHTAITNTEDDTSNFSVLTGNPSEGLPHKLSASIKGSLDKSYGSIRTKELSLFITIGSNEYILHVFCRWKTPSHSFMTIEPHTTSYEMIIAGTTSDYNTAMSVFDVYSIEDGYEPVIQLSVKAKKEIVIKPEVENLEYDSRTNNKLKFINLNKDRIFLDEMKGYKPHFNPSSHLPCSSFDISWDGDYSLYGFDPHHRRISLLGTDPEEFFIVLLPSPATIVNSIMGAFGASVLKKYMNDVRRFIPLMERERLPYRRISYNEADLIAIVRTDIVIFYMFLSIIEREGRSSFYHHLLHEYEELIKTHDDGNTILYEIHQDFTMKYSQKRNKFIFPFKNIVTAKYDIYQSVQAGVIVEKAELTGTSLIKETQKLKQVDVSSHTIEISNDAVQFKVVGNEYRVYKWDKYDLSLEVPATALAQGKMATITIRAIPSTDDFTLPEDDMYLVSGIYHIECQEVFQEEVTIRIKHTAITDTEDDTSHLTILMAKGSSNEFKPMASGHFDPEFAFIKIKEFSRWSLASKRYICQVFYQLISPYSKWKMAVVIMKNKNTTVKRIVNFFLEKNYTTEVGDQFGVYFKKNVKAIIIYSPLNEKWDLTPTKYPPKISLEDVIKFKTSSLSYLKDPLACCVFNISWKDASSVPEQCNREVLLDGTRDNNCFIPSVPFCHISQSSMAVLTTPQHTLLAPSSLIQPVLSPQGSSPPALSSPPTIQGSPQPALSSPPTIQGSPQRALSSPPTIQGSPQPALSSPPTIQGSPQPALSSPPTIQGSPQPALSSPPTIQGLPQPALSSPPTIKGLPQPALSSPPTIQGSPQPALFSPSIVQPTDIGPASALKNNIGKVKDAVSASYVTFQDIVIACEEAKLITTEEKRDLLDTSNFKTTQTRSIELINIIQVVTGIQPTYLDVFLCILVNKGGIPGSEVAKSIARDYGGSLPQYEELLTQIDSSNL